MEYIINVRGIKKAFKQKEVLKDVSFMVKKGQIFTLLGSNGAGKTTMIRILSTLLKPDQGEVLINQLNLKDHTEEIKDLISLTGQYVAVDENLTGRENLHLIGRLMKIKDYRKKTDHYLKMFELAKSGDALIKTYSGGMKRKLDIAMSLISNPKIIFLDEPTTGLDPQSRLVLWNIIKMLKRQGITIFLTTQYLEEAEALSDYIAILNDGVIINAGEARELKALFPQGQTLISFSQREDYQRAITLLEGYSLELESDTKTVKLNSKINLKDLSEILLILANHHLNPERIEKKQASLEEVFLHLINHQTNMEELTHE